MFSASLITHSLPAPLRPPSPASPAEQMVHQSRSKREDRNQFKHSAQGVVQGLVTQLWEEPRAKQGSADT